MDKFENPESRVTELDLDSGELYPAASQISVIKRGLRWPQPLHSLQNKNFRYFWFGQAISQFGTWMQIVAQSWIVYALTDSPFMLGLVNFAALLPVVPISLIAGVMSDRFSRKKIVIVAEIILTFQALVIAVLLWLELLQIWHIMLLSFILGAAASMEQPARLALVVETVGEEDLSNAVALNSFATNVARVVGPSIAGVLLASWGAAACFALNGFSYLAVIFSMLAIHLVPQKRQIKDVGVSSGLLQGLQFAWRSSQVRGLLIIVALSSFLTLPILALMPIFSEDILNSGPQGLGFLMGGIGVGALIGSLMIASLKAGSRGVWLAVVNIVAPGILFLFCISRIFAISFVIVTFLGAANAIRQILSNSLLQIIALGEYHGRVMSLFYLIFNGMSRTGALTLGGIAEFIGVPLTLGVSAILSIIAGIVVYFKIPSLARIE